MTKRIPGDVICYASQRSLNELSNIAISFSIKYQCRIKVRQFDASIITPLPEKAWVIEVAQPPLIEGYGYWIAPMPADDEPIPTEPPRSAATLASLQKRINDHLTRSLNAESAHAFVIPPVATDGEWKDVGRVPEEGWSQRWVAGVDPAELSDADRADIVRRASFALWHDGGIPLNIYQGSYNGAVAASAATHYPYHAHRDCLIDYLADQLDEEEDDS